MIFFKNNLLECLTNILTEKAYGRKILTKAGLI